MAVSEAERVIQALGALEGVKGVWRSYPREMGGEQLPCLVVEKADERGVDYRDGREYLTEMEFYVRIFAQEPIQADVAAQGARLAMEAIGYQRMQEWEDLHSETRQIVARYRTTVKAAG